MKRVELRENLRAFFPQGQRKLSVITRCPIKRVSVKRGSTVYRFENILRKLPRKDDGAILKCFLSFAVTIHVQDTNNHRPEFLQSSYWVSLPNDANIGTTVLTVKAYDLDEGDNAKITYKLSNDMFDVHPSKGVITLKQGFGSVTNRKYEFSVRATDQGIPNRQSAVSVSVSVHSLSFIPPKFNTSVYRTVVPENFSTGVLLLTVHAQKSVSVRSSIEYYIVGGDPQDRFSVGTRSGVFTLRKSLDYEKAKQHVLVVRAVQKGLSRDIPSLPTEVSTYRLSFF